MEQPTLLKKIMTMRTRQQYVMAYLPIIALTCTVALSASLTSLNRDLVKEQPPHQSVFTSFFCIEAAVVYALYMIISRMLSFFLSYIESSSSASGSDKAGYMASYYYDHIEEDHDEENGVLLDTARAKHAYKMSSVFLHESPLFSYHGGGFNNGHREALISSMYLGGAGAFLSLPALCFWDFSITASFLLSLTLIALLNDHTKHAEFKANQDKQHVLSVIQRFRWLLYAAVIAVILGVLLQDSSYDNYNYYYYYSSYFTSANQTTPPVVMRLDERPWPMMLLSFSSPLLMRMGTINPRTIAHKISMSPSQSLEVGLPISNLLAILVLCWYSPLDSLFAHSNINMQRFIPMLVLCPSCLAAVLAFILRGFRNKQTLGVVVPLATTCIIAQQIMDRKMRNSGDWALVGGAAAVLLLSMLFILYRQKVLADEPSRKEIRKEEEDPPEAIPNGETETLSATMHDIDLETLT